MCMRMSTRTAWWLSSCKQVLAEEGNEFLLFAALLRHMAARDGVGPGQQVGLLRELNRQAARMPAALAMPALITSLRVP